MPKNPAGAERTRVPGSLDRRRAPRVPCGLYVNEVSDGADGLSLCRATNISETGIYLRRLRGGVLLEGERVTLELSLPGEADALWLGGRVVEQVQEPLHEAAAIHFETVTADDRRRLRGYVERVRKRQLRAALNGIGALCRAP